MEMSNQIKQPNKERRWGIIVNHCNITDNKKNLKGHLHRKTTIIKKKKKKKVAGIFSKFQKRKFQMKKSDKR